MANLRQRFTINTDAVILIAVMLATIIGGYYVATMSIITPPEQTFESPVDGAFFGVIAVVWAVVLVGLYRVWKRIPEQVRKLLKTTARVAYWSFLGLLLSATAWYAPKTRPYISGAVALLLVAHYVEDTKLDWVVFNLVAFLLSVTILGVAAPTISAPAIIAFLFVMMAYDYMAVDLTDIMGDLVDFSSNVGIPNFYIIPNQLYIDSDRVIDALNSTDVELPKSVRSIIGVGDFALPSLLIVSVALDAGLSSVKVVGATIGVVLSIGVLVASMENRDKGLPALPWVCSGAIGGYAVATIVVVL